MIERSFLESFDLSEAVIDSILAEIASTVENETASIKSELDRAVEAMDELEKRVSFEKRKSFVHGALKAAGMTSELAAASAAEMLVSDDADVNDTLDEEIEKLKILDPAAFAPMPLPKSELPAFSSAAPRTKLPETSPLFENGTPIFSFLRRPQSNG